MQLLNICALIVTLVFLVVNFMTDNTWATGPESGYIPPQPKGTEGVSAILMTDDQLYRNLLATLISEDKLEEWEAKAAELELPLDYYIQEFV